MDNGNSKGMISGLISFIMKDTTTENESIKMLVLIRVLILSVFVYFLLNILINVHILDSRGLVLTTLFAVGFVSLFGMSYRLKVRSATFVFSVGIIVFVWQNLEWFGWWVGVQHFLIMILVIIFFVGYGKYQLKALLATIICMIRILFYYRYSGGLSQYVIPEHTKDLLQILNTFAIFWCISLVSYTFAKSSREMESKLVKYNEKLEQQALTDNLTGLFNRRGGLEYIRKFLADNRFDNFSLCMCDIDFFKKVNDTWGHECGDLVLKEISSIFKKEMKGHDMPCRWGGEEFLLLFPGSNGDDAYNRLVDIRDKIKALVVHYEGHEIKITMTFGLTEYDFRKDIDDAIAEADERLYYGKNNGRDQVVF
ncbi:MAG: GGDEF domain-containing protein [Lachnospiraceae bacterium]|nr:GGDEF domain-containing protein [Lachnospiraceae bacterium]